LTTNSCINGTVYVDNEVYSELPEVKITATGPYGTVTTFSESDGSFWFKNVGNGTYNLEASLAGYGTRKAFGIQVFGQDTAYAFLGSLNSLPDKTLKTPDLVSVITDINRLIITVNYSYYCEPFPVRFFMGKNPDVSCDKFDYSLASHQDPQNCGFILFLDNIPLKSGEKMYLTGYIYNPADNGYLDMYYNKLVFPTLNKTSQSNVVSYIVP
jgi:hypothetical protein